MMLEKGKYLKINIYIKYKHRGAKHGKNNRLYNGKLPEMQ